MGGGVVMREGGGDVDTSWGVIRIWDLGDGRKYGSVTVGIGTDTLYSM